MKNKCLKIALGVALIFFSGIISSKKAFATDYIQPTHDTTESTVYGTAGQVIGTGFTNNEKITSISVYSDEGSLENINMAIYRKSSPITDWGDGDFGDYIYLNWRDGTTPTYSNGQWHFDLSNASDNTRTLEEGYYYFILFNFGGGSSLNFYGSTNANDWVNGESHKGTYNGVWQSTTNIVDLGFSFTTDGISTPQNSIDFYDPVNNDTINDFGLLSCNPISRDCGWVVDAVAPADKYYDIEIYYGTSTGVSETNYYWWDDNNSSFNGGSERIVVAKEKLLDVGDWYAKAFLYDITDYENVTLVDTSDEIHFVITGGQAMSGGETPTAPPSVTCAEGDFVCSIQKWFAETFTAIINYLFQPSKTTLNAFGDLWIPVKDKIPFGYLTKTFTAFNSLFTSDSPAYVLPEVSVLENISDIIGIALWILFGAYAIRRIGRMKI